MPKIFLNDSINLSYESEISLIKLIIKPLLILTLSTSSSFKSYLNGETPNCFADSRIPPISFFISSIGLNGWLVTGMPKTLKFIEPSSLDNFVILSFIF